MSRIYHEGDFANCGVPACGPGGSLCLAQWLGKGGYGGDMRFREHATDPLLVTAALAPLTRNIILISTVHILYGWHPLHLAKFAASIDHMSHGRWELNAVTGYKTSNTGCSAWRRSPTTFATRWPMSSRSCYAAFGPRDENLTVEG